jgi:aldehyde dehydrogenase (NAD+)
MKSLLEKLQLDEMNPGACSGPDAWIMDDKSRKLDSINPTTGETIASVMMVTEDSYNQVVQKAQEGFNNWRQIPAPKRGQVVRELGNGQN